jgi:hypothetical protein
MQKENYITNNLNNNAVDKNPLNNKYNNFDSNININSNIDMNNSNSNINNTNDTNIKTINKFRRKRIFKDTEMDAFNHNNIEKGLSNLTINKKFKITGNNKYNDIVLEIPVNQYLTNSSSSIDESKRERKMMINYDEIDNEENCNLNKNNNNNNNINTKLDMDIEKQLVEDYYSQRNKMLFNEMFGN